MTDLGSSRPTVTTSSPETDTDSPSGWTGWIVFASFMMFLLGSFQAIQGLVAILNDDYYAVTSSGLVIDLDFTVWGWVHLLLGVLVVLCGAGVLRGNLAARIGGVVLAGLSAIANLLFIEAYPVWSIVVITVDVLVIYALTVHGHELRNSTL